jgi:hypothetical protein
MGSIIIQQLSKWRRKYQICAAGGWKTYLTPKHIWLPRLICLRLSNQRGAKPMTAAFYVVMALSIILMLLPILAAAWLGY